MPTRIIFVGNERIVFEHLANGEHVVQIGLDRLVFPHDYAWRQFVQAVRHDSE